MRRDGDIVSYTAEELREMRERGEDLTDWERVGSLTDEEIEELWHITPDGTTIEIRP